MGNYRFRLSDMMPNAWFYKLRDMSKLKTHNKTTLNNPRKSFYSINSPINPKFFDTPLPNYNPPTITKPSSNKISKRKTVYMPSPTKISPSAIFQNHGPTSSDDQDFLQSLSEFDSYDDDDDDSFHDQSCSCEFTSSASDIIIDVDECKLISELELPPIVTKSRKLESPKLKKNRGSTGSRKSVSRSGGVRIRRNGRRRSVKSEKKGLFYSESFAVVKASFDPEKDFKDSMMEMILENNIRASKDLEDLLACYLSLNENEYHVQIIKAFEQIWFNIPHLQV